MAMLALLSKFTTVRPEARFVVIKELEFAKDRAAYPSGGLVEDSEGTLYGLTAGGGKFGRGTLFGIRPGGSGVQVLHGFAGGEQDGANPCGELVLTPEGALLGTTLFGGTADGGAIFRIQTDGGRYRILHSFSNSPQDGASAIGGLTLDVPNTVFGTTYVGGRNTIGTVFRIDTDGGGYCILRHFDNATGDGANPLFGVTVGSDGALYGTTSRGGDCGLGTIYRLEPDGSEFVVLRSYGEEWEEGVQPGCKLLARDGMLYGTTSAGGTFGCGTVFRMSEDGTWYTVLHHFHGGEGAFPGAGLVEGRDGWLYGTAMGGASFQGTVFRLNPNGRGMRIIHTFDIEGHDGATPCFPLLAGTKRMLYGTCREGGRDQAGVVFSIRTSNRSHR